MISHKDLAPDLCTLVPARPTDGAFLRQLFIEVETAAMPVTLPALVQMGALQFDAKSASYRQDFPRATDLVIQKDGIVVGRILIDLDARTLHAIDMAILPAWQSRGIGASVLRALCFAARAQGCNVSLTVIEGQPAQRLYQKLGFQITARRAPHVTMLWTCDAD